MAFAQYLLDSIPIQSTILKAVIEESLDILGQSAKMLIIEDLKERGLDLDVETGAILSTRSGRRY
jgi:hypothetical protein